MDRLRRIISIAMPVFLIISCRSSTEPGPLKQQQSNTETINQPSLTPAYPLTSTPEPLPSSTHPPSNESMKTTQVEVELSVEGPWLIYKNSDGYLVAINEDGTGRKVLTTDASTNSLVASIGPYLTYMIPSPVGGLLAYRTVSGDSNVQLTILHLPDGGTVDEILLMSPGNEEELLAVVAFDPVWSPSGRYLAFVGAIDGPSADIYLYDRQDGSIRWLTDGLNTAGMLQWSPDGKWIVHESISRIHFMRPGGRVTLAVWAASVDGSEVKKLYDFPYQENIESGVTQVFHGWISDDRFVVAFESPYDYTVNKAYVVDVTKGDYAELPYHSFNYSGITFDPTSETLLMVFDSVELTQGAILQGLYVVYLDGGEPRRISEELAYLRWYPEIERSVVQGYDTTMIVNTDGEIDAELSEIGSEIYPSPNGRWFGYYGNGALTIYSLEGDIIQRFPLDWMHANHPLDLFWLPDSSGYYFKGDVTDGPGFNFYLVDEVGGEPVLIASDFTIASFPGPYPDVVWVMP